MDKEQTAIARLKEAAHMSERFYKAPLIVTTNGGKDSSVCVALAERAGINFEVIHNHTTVDAPETVYFIRREFKRLEERKRRGKMQGTWRIGTTGRDIFHWWMEDGVLPGQIELEGLEGED